MAFRLMVLGLLWCSCTSVNRCKANTLLVHVSLDAAAAQADQLVVIVTVGTSSIVNPAQPHEVGVSSGNLVVDFPNGYPRGSQVVVQVVALVGGREIGEQETSPITLENGCTASSLSIAAGDLSTSTADLLGSEAGPEDLLDVADLNGLDLARTIDLAGIDLANCTPVAENCFNKVDDDCDGLVDCDDPDCVGGATPKAICVPDPGSFSVGVVISSPSNCPPEWPAATQLKAGLMSSCSIGSCAGCTNLTSGGYGPPDDCFALLYDWDSLSCGGGVGHDVRASTGNNVCMNFFNQIPSNHYHSVQVGSYSGSCNNPSGTAGKDTPTWTTNDAFCTGGMRGGGCASGELCVPTGPKQCVIKVGAQQPCPSGYVATPAYYTSYDDTGRSCNCGCTITSFGSCSGTPTVTVYTDPGCTLGAITVANSCGNADISGHIYAKGTGMTVTTHATCGHTVTMSGTTVPTGEQTVCCMP